jgi:hypothetical protein
MQEPCGFSPDSKISYSKNLVLHLCFQLFERARESHLNRLVDSVTGQILKAALENLGTLIQSRL